MEKVTVQKPDENKPVIIQQIVLGQQRRQREDIGTWMDAIQQAERVSFPRWKRLLELYDRIVLDGHASATIAKRIRVATNTPLHYVGPGNTRDQAMEKLSRLPWFRDLVTFIMESIFWGHSLIEPRILPGGRMEARLVYRHHVDRVRGLIHMEEWSESDVKPYREGIYARHLLEVGKPRDLGLLMKIAPYVLYKQGGIADWSQFGEIFGMPLRIYTYDPLDPTSRREVEKSAVAQGSAAYIIVPKGVEVDSMETSNAAGSGEMYDGLRKAMNEEISITVLGVNLTTSNGKTGTYALGEVHADEQKEVHEDDLTFVEGVLNDQAREFFRYWGIPVKDGYEWKYDTSEKMSLAARIDLDVKLNAVAPIDRQYFYETYNVPPGEEPEPEPDPEPGQPKRPKRPAPGKKPEGHSHADAVAHVCGTNEYEVPKAINARIERLWRKMLDRLWRGLIPEGKADRDMVLATGNMLFRDAFGQGFGAYDLKDVQFLASIHENLFTFSGAKNAAELRELRDLVFQNGKKIPFTQFRARAKEIFADYREDWLKTEYNQVVRAGTMGRQWRDVSRTKDLYPYLRYVTEGDSRVRPEHVSLNGITLPVDHDFWNSYFPPNGWNCRCSVRRVSQADIDGGKHTLTPDNEAIEAARNSGTDLYWMGNVGKSGSIFREGHRYFDKLSAADIDYLKGIAHQVQDADPFLSQAGYLPSRRIAGPNDTYTDVHIRADRSDIEENVQAAMALNAQGYSVRIRPHIYSQTGVKNPELEVLVGTDWILFDLKRLESTSVNAIRRKVKRASAQGANALIRVMSGTLGADLVQALKASLSPGTNKAVSVVWLVYPDGKMVQVSRDEIGTLTSLPDA